MTDAETARKGKLLEEYAKAVSEEIRTSLRDAVKLSPSDFSEVARFHESIDWTRIAQQCGEKIRDRVDLQFGETWEQYNMVTKIAVLELLKKRTKNKDIAQWRPSNKTPSEQCRPYIMEILNGKNYYLHQYLQEQQTKLVEELVPAVDYYRERIRRISEQRDTLLSQMKRMDSNQLNDDIIVDLEQSLKFLRQLNRVGGCGPVDNQD